MYKFPKGPLCQIHGNVMAGMDKGAKAWTIANEEKRFNAYIYLKY